MEQLYIYTKMQLSPIRNKYITFSCSGRTIEWLELDIPRNYVYKIGYRQYVKRMYDPTRDRQIQRFWR